LRFVVARKVSREVGVTTLDTLPVLRRLSGMQLDRACRYASRQLLGCATQGHCVAFSLCQHSPTHAKPTRNKRTAKQGRLDQ
jgi:hypothetical protein